MEARSRNHPPADTLKAFALGQMSHSSAEAVLNHLDSCADCCQAVAAQSGDDFLNRLRQAQGRSVTPAPAQSLAASLRESKSPPLPSQTPIPNLPPELATNQQYEIVRELGRGGMGIVYLARNKIMDRLEVLKVINKTLLDRPGAVERFLREIRSAAKLSHANVVTAYSAVQQGDLLAFAMEFVEGDDLAKLVKSRGPLPVIHACYYVQQAALGLQHAFENDMVHRDIKPQNLILTRKGKRHFVKVLDFGLAKVRREKSVDTGLTGEGAMLGTPDYIAPEQSLDAARADIRADIYSLGCTLYYLLSGHPPFSATSLSAILLAHQMQEAKPLNVVRSEVPEELASLVRKMMAKAPAKRYQTPLELAEALAPFINPGATATPAPELSSGPVEAKPGVEKAARVDPPRLPVAPEVKRPPEPRDVWGSLMDGSMAAVGPQKSRVVRKRRAATLRERTSRNKWLMGGGIGVGLLLLALVGMWAGGVFKVKTKDGILVVEVNEPNPDVYVDGEKITVRWDEGGKKAEIQVKPGTRKVEISKDGFTAHGEEVALTEGRRQIIKARLESSSSVPPGDVKPTQERSVSGAIPAGLTHEAWLKWSKGLNAKKILDAVSTRLRERNPDFDGKIQHKIEEGQVVSLQFAIDSIKDISPLQALPGLRKLSLIGSWWRKGQLADLTPLKGMKLTTFTCTHTQVADLSPLQGMPLTELECLATSVQDLSQLKDMKLRSLTFGYSLASDLSPLRGMPLTKLALYYTQVRDLSPLRDMSLTTLVCWAAPVTDADLTLLERMSTLRELQIVDTKITDAGLVHLKKLTDLELLFCARMKLTSACLTHIEGLTKLHTLHVDYTDLTDEGLVHLKRMRGLRELFINQTRVTDTGLAHLTGLKNLALLKLNGTAVTEKGVAKLKAALPKCAITR